MKKSRNVDDLLAAIQRKAPHAEPEVQRDQPAPSTSVEPPVAAVRKRSGRIGKAVQFWMHDEDRKILRELSAWLASQGVRPSDSLVIRTALRTARTGADLLQAYHEAAQLDGRLKQNTDGTGPARS